MKETKGTIGGITYDENEYTITIKVVDDGEGNLVADEGYHLVETQEITNEYSASGKGEIKVKKNLDGRDWTDGDTFTFTLSAVNGAPMPAADSLTIAYEDASKIKSFGEIEFTE